MNSARRFLVAALVAFGLAYGWTGSVRALTNQDIAGTYQGTSTVNFPDGQTINVGMRLIVKANGKLKRVATFSGQTVKAYSTVQFVTERTILESPKDGSGESVGFIDLDGTTLTLDLLARLEDGQVAKEPTTVTRVK